MIGLGLALFSHVNWLMDHRAPANKLGLVVWMIPAWALVVVGSVGVMLGRSAGASGISDGRA